MRSRWQVDDSHVIVQGDAIDQEQQPNVIEKSFAVVIRVGSDVSGSDHRPVLRRCLAEYSMDASQYFNSCDIIETVCRLDEKNYP